MRVSLVSLLFLLCCWSLSAQELVKYPPIARVLPPVGIKPDAEMAKKLRAEVEQLEADLKPYDPRDKQGNWNDPQFQYFADIAIFPKAVRWALDYDEFYKPADFATAEKQLKLGRERLEELKSGVKQPSWTTQRGLTVRGYISPIDNSVQPYGVHVPENVDLSQKLPLYIWLHGRGEKVTDLHFIQERLTSRGKFAADDGITVYPFGRYCNAFKFMGERDVLDVMQQAEVRYQTDPRKRILIGFSMGGAGVWHIGSRYPHLFCAIAPGAGFSESREFLGITDDKLPPWYEQELWKWYDAPTYVENLFTLPVIAYSGEKDKQKQAADVMEREFAKHGKKLNHIIGPGMGHDYDKESLAKISTFLKEQHQNENKPQFVTSQRKELVETMKFRGVLGYNAIRHHNLEYSNRIFEHSIWNEVKFHSVKNIGDITELEVEATVTNRERPTTYTLVKILNTKNIKTLFIGNFGANANPPPKVIFENQEQKLHVVTFVEDAYGNYTGGCCWAYTYLQQADNHWQSLSEEQHSKTKQFEFNGPIDQAFNEPFLFVKPTGVAASPAIQQWVDTEMQYQLDRWRRCFRGEIQVIKDTEWSHAKYGHRKLVLWGDAQSNVVIRALDDCLPVYGSQPLPAYLKEKFDPKQHVCSGIFLVNEMMHPHKRQLILDDLFKAHGLAVPKDQPNGKKEFKPIVGPVVMENWQHKILLNSGPTFRDEHDRNNANQTPKLPDWAIIDVTTPPDGKAPGKVVTAGFFDNEWKFVDPAKQEAEWRARKGDGR